MQYFHFKLHTFLRRQVLHIVRKLLLYNPFLDAAVQRYYLQNYHLSVEWKQSWFTVTDSKINTANTTYYQHKCHGLKTCYNQIKELWASKRQLNIDKLIWYVILPIFSGFYLHYSGKSFLIVPCNIWSNHVLAVSVFWGRSWKYWSHQCFLCHISNHLGPPWAIKKNTQKFIFNQEMQY